LCPTTEADLGDGFFEAEHWQDRGGQLAIGSDSNLRISPREELRLLEFGIRLRSGRRNVLARDGMGCGSALYTMAAEGGGAALGQPVGRVAKGFRADLVELDETHPLLCGVEENDILDRYVFAGDKSMIRTVLVGGRQRVINGMHEARDATAGRFVAVMEELAR
jgi:formimidoylglutamate deiminase